MKMLCLDWTKRKRRRRTRRMRRTDPGGDKSNIKSHDTKITRVTLKVSSDYCVAGTPYYDDQFIEIGRSNPSMCTKVEDYSQTCLIRPWVIRIYSNPTRNC